MTNARMLILKIIERAVLDYKEIKLGFHHEKVTVNHRVDYKKEARKFLISEECIYMCEIIDIDHYSILENLGIEK